MPPPNMVIVDTVLVVKIRIFGMKPMAEGGVFVSRSFCLVFFNFRKQALQRCVTAVLFLGWI